jgi:hypothetical protein
MFIRNAALPKPQQWQFFLTPEPFNLFVDQTSSPRRRGSKSFKITTFTRFLDHRHGII